MGEHTTTSEQLNRKLNPDAAFLVAYSMLTSNVTSGALTDSRPASLALVHGADLKFANGSPLSTAVEYGATSVTAQLLQAGAMPSVNELDLSLALGRANTNSLGRHDTQSSQVKLSSWNETIRLLSLHARQHGTDSSWLENCVRDCYGDTCA
jgi:hypothetical protein